MGVRACQSCDLTAAGKDLGPTEFERLAGKASSKKWKASCRVIAPDGSTRTTIGDYLVVSGLSFWLQVLPIMVQYVMCTADAANGCRTPADLDPVTRLAVGITAEYSSSHKQVLCADQAAGCTSKAQTSNSQGATDCSSRTPPAWAPEGVCNCSRDQRPCGCTVSLPQQSRDSGPVLQLEKAGSCPGSCVAIMVSTCRP